MSDAARAVDGTLAGIPARELAEIYGTPLFLIDLDVLDLELDRFTRACAPHGIALAYAGKAFLCAALAEHFAATPLRLDVCSLGELVTAENGGFPAGRMYFHGCGKTDAELRAIVERRVAFDGGLVRSDISLPRPIQTARRFPKRRARGSDVQAH